MAEELSCTPTLDGLMSYEGAVERLVAAVRRLDDRERVTLRDGLGRVLAEPVVSTIDVPRWDYSAMDGYVLRAADFDGPGSTLAAVPVRSLLPAKSVMPESSLLVRLRWVSLAMLALSVKFTVTVRISPT